MSTYFSEITRSMEEISKSDSSIFIGQAVAVAGTAMRNTLVNIPQHKLIEFPVDEDVQLGFSIGLSLAGFTPISIFPRWNFLLLATNQIVNHLDKLKELFVAQSDNTHYYFAVLTNKGNCWKDLQKITIKQSPNSNKYIFVGFVYSEFASFASSTSSEESFDVLEQPPLPIMDEFTDY